jgi:hypothetical protein
MSYAPFLPIDPTGAVRPPIPPFVDKKRHLLTPLCCTANGVTWEQICRSGLANPDSKVGIYAGDAESYDLFWEELRPIVSHCHDLPELDRLLHLPPDLLCPPVASSFSQVRSTRLRLARNLDGVRFPSAMRKADRQQVYQVVKDALKEMPGAWFDLETMSTAQRRVLADARLLFTNEDRFMASANIYEHWPLGRAIFVTPDGQRAIWINEEDHLRIMAVVPGYRPAEALVQLQHLLDFLEQRLAFAWSPRLGYLTSCPSNLGTGLRASVLAHCTDVDAAAFRRCGMQLRSAYGEHATVVDNLYDISPRQRLGVSEREILLRLDSALSHVFSPA